MNDQDPPPPQVGPRGEPSPGTSGQNTWLAIAGGCLGGIGIALAGLAIVSVVLLGLVIYTCGGH